MRKRVSEAERAIASHETGLEKSGVLFDTTELEVALKAARAEGPLEKKIAEEEKKRQMLLASCDAAIAVLPLFERDAATLRSLRLPLLETIECFGQSAAALEQTLRLKQSEVERLSAVVREMREKSFGLGNENTGTAEKLATLRAERDVALSAR